MGKFKPRPMSEAPRDGRFIGVVYRDGNSAVVVRFGEYAWFGTYGECVFVEEEADGYLWFYLPRRWLEMILRYAVKDQAHPAPL